MKRKNKITLHLFTGKSDETPCGYERRRNDKTNTAASSSLVPWVFICLFFKRIAVEVGKGLWRLLSPPAQVSQLQQTVLGPSPVRFWIQKMKTSQLLWATCSHVSPLLQQKTLCLDEIPCSSICAHCLLSCPREPLKRAWLNLPYSLLSDTRLYATALAA